MGSSTAPHFFKSVRKPKTTRRSFIQKADVYLINRENVEWLVNYYQRNWPFKTVIIDELSSFKSSSAKRFKALRKVRPKMERVIGLTGTPSPNSLMDLWAQMYLLDQGERLGKPSPNTAINILPRTKTGILFILGS